MNEEEKYKIALGKIISLTIIGVVALIGIFFGKQGLMYLGSIITIIITAIIIFINV